MASPETSKRDGGGQRVGRSAGLPLDALFEILLRLPAREICRLRAVCWSWRALGSDRLFIDAHASRHPAPYIAASFSEDGGDGCCGVDIIDLSSGGDVVKRVHAGFRDFRVQRARLDLVCLVEGLNPLAVAVMNPATGATATCSPAKSISEDYEHLLKSCYVTMDSCAFGKVPSTGEYKAFRFLRFGSPRQLCEVMTLNGCGVSKWRAMQGPPAPVCSSSIVPFNLETEEWMGTLKGPEPVTRFYREHNEVVVSSSSQVVELLSLTDLNGSLVTVHAVCNSCMDLWFLSDFEKGLWVKKYSIDFPYNRRSAYPLLLLDDERVVFLVQATDVLQCYDPKAGTYTDMLELESFRSVGIYTGNLLSLEDGFA